MKKVFGILFFYTICFHNENGYGKNGFDTRRKYINEKANRYLNVNVSKSEWELLNIRLSDVPTFDSDRYLTSNHIIKLIYAFNEIFNLDNINYDNMNMCGYEEGNETLFNNIYKDFNYFVSILGSSNGVSIVLCRWLEKMDYQKSLIERELCFISLDI